MSFMLFMLYHGKLCVVKYLNAYTWSDVKNIQEKKHSKKLLKIIAATNRHVPKNSVNLK